jgi:hypothetical protein
MILRRREILETFHSNSHNAETLINRCFKK